MKSNRFGVLSLVLTLLLGLVAMPVPAQEAESEAEAPADPNVTMDPKYFDGLEYRHTGFARGGRSTAVVGVPGDPLQYFAGYTGGGVWHTHDAGTTWNNVSDEFFNVASIGDIKIAPSDPNVIYVGTGSGCPRGNISVGDGIYKSTDAGKTWDHIWNPGFVQIPEMVVHPDNPDVVFAAVLGDIFGPNEERGLYKTTDGGLTWEKILYISDQTGFNDIEMDPSNPRILYATAWTVYRNPWTIHSGSEEGGVWRSKDGGDTWEKLGGGLPGGVVGKIDVTVSPPMPERVWALVEAPGAQGGVYRSDDGGDSWRPMAKDRKLLQRAWYYIHIIADPVDPDTVYSLNTGFFKSIDGGATFPTALQPRHGDNHDLWLNPENPQWLINGNDGGANVSLNGGETFSEQMNQPTAEFYRVTVDNATPYNVYGAQQDNSTAAMNAASGGAGLFGFGGAQFFEVGGGESGHIAVDPRDNNIIYAGSYGGAITRRDRSTGETRNIRAYEDAPTGQQASDMKYRFQWNAPIRISPHDPDVVYHTSQYVHRTNNAGLDWEIISPDLTTNNAEMQGYSGSTGITQDNTGVEVYTTIFAFEESPQTAGLLWAGSDDGMVHISQDNGGTWNDITPANIPQGGTVNMIDLSAHDPGRAHIAVYQYREQNYLPYIFQTNDYGQNWTLLTDGMNGIPDNHFVRVVREDPNRRGMLFAGTEFGMYASFDDGVHWQSFQLNLPAVPVTDMVIKDSDLVLSTQGRAFYVLDDFSVLSALTPEVLEAPITLLPPTSGTMGSGTNPSIAYMVNQVSQTPVQMVITGPDGEVFFDKQGIPAEGAGGDEDIRVPSFVPEEFREQFIEAVKRGDTIMGMDLSVFRGSGDALNVKPGLNTQGFSGRWPSIYDIPDGTVQWAFGGGIGPAAVPGAYTVTLSMGDYSATEMFEWAPNPNSTATAADYAEQLAMANEVGAAAKLLYDEVLQLRSVKTQATGIGRMLSEAGYGDEASTAASALNEKLTAVEGELTQLQGEGGQDSLNFPGRLDQQFNGLYGAISGGQAPMGSGVKERWADLEPTLAPLIAQIHEIYAADLTAFNELVGANGMRVLLKKEEDATDE
ncbi:MAG: glycosyl hydrolase [Acidobacteria bacterium]|nr:glycosyl hydrolase [Acidobacteriota bacterium]